MLILCLFAVSLFARKVVTQAFFRENVPLAALGNDFAAYFMGAWELSQGRSPYYGIRFTERVAYPLDDTRREVLGVSSEIMNGYIYPPPFAMLLRHFVHLPFRSVLRWWLAINILLACVCMALCIALFSQPERDRQLFAANLVLMLLCLPLLQIHYLIFAFPALLVIFARLFAHRQLAIGLVFVLGVLLVNFRGWNAFEHWSSHWSPVFLIAPQAWGLLIIGGLLFWLNSKSSARIQIIGGK